MTNTAEISELDALYRAGILTEDEHAEAQRKLRARAVQTATEPALPAELEPAGHSLGHATKPRSGGRHARPASPRWPWVVVAVLAAIAIVTVSAALLKPSHHRASAKAAAASSAPAQAPAIVAGSRVNTAVTINLNGANAQITVSALTAVPVSPAAAKTAKTTTYQVMVTAVASTGSFQLQPSNFTAQSSTGHTYLTTIAAQDPMVPSVVLAGHQAQGEIAFTVPKAEHISAILFTTSLGEQLGVWST